MNLCIVSSQGINSMAVEVLIQITVIAPCSIRIREMAVAFTGGDTTFEAITTAVTIGIGMNMETGTVSGDPLNGSKETSR